DPAKRTAEITRLKTVLETKKTKINDVLEKRKKLNELNKKKKDYEGPTGEIQKLTDEIARNKIVTDKIPDLETKAKAARGKVKPLEDAAKEAEAEFKKLNDDLTEKQKPKKAAEAKLTAARAKLVAAEGLARTRIPSIEGDKAYRQNAFGAIHQIDEEGQHLWRHFRSIESVNEAGDSIDVKERMKDLLGRKTTILVDVLKTELKKPGNLADVTDLPVKEGTLRSAVGAARKELSFLMENGADREARITELTDLVSNLTGKMRTMLAAESNGALAPASRLKPAEKYAAVQREIYYLEQHHAEDPAAVARLKVLQGEEGLSGKLKDILWEQHSALHAATERALDLVRKGAKYDTIGNEQLEPARDSVRAEVLFLKKFPYDAPRFAQLKTDWDGLNRVRVERNALALRQEADRTVKEAGSRGGASRFGAMEALESEARDVRARGGKPEEMNRIKEQRDAQADLSVREALQAADVALVSRDRRAMHAAVNTVTSALDFMEKVEDRIPAGKMAELKGRLTALRQSLAVVNEEQIRNALAPDAAPGNIRETYLCIRDEMRMLRENKHYQRDIMASGRQRDLSISLTQVVQRLDNEITAIHKNMKDGASIQRGLELIAVEREFRTTMEMQLHPGMPEPNTYWIGELAKMEADLNREIGTVKEEKEGTRAVVTAELKKILGQISSVEAEADLEKKRTFLPWLEEQERFFKAGADRNPELVATFLPRIQEQLRLTRTFEQSRDAFARDLQALTGKVDQQTQRILQAYAKLTERGGGTLAEKTKQLQDHVAAGTALQKEAQAALTYAQDPGWKKQIDTTAITQAITVLGGRITDGQNAVDSLAGGRGAPPAPPAAPGGGGSRRSRPPLTA
ncbi:MAG: hypothetical protein Q7S29_03990, partial [Candidatus Peribacter sp.]|nr:hypothetical protein [Candidatus Peribacter sp.]